MLQGGRSRPPHLVQLVAVRRVLRLQEDEQLLGVPAEGGPQVGVQRQREERLRGGGGWRGTDVAMIAETTSA